MDTHQITRLFVESYIYIQYQERVIGYNEKQIIDVEIMADVDIYEDIKKQWYMQKE